MHSRVRNACYSAGKRKCSIARVWVMPGSGQIRVNKRRMTEYFPALARRMDVLKPFEVSGTLGHFDVMSTVRGGGSTGAISMGVGYYHVNLCTSDKRAIGSSVEGSLAKCL